MIALLGLLACSPCPDPDDVCDAADDVRTGDYVLTSSSWAEIQDGDLTIAEDGLTIEYVDERGRTIRVRYERTQ